jgi:hypothetical protein
MENRTIEYVSRQPIDNLIDDIANKLMPNGFTYMTFIECEFIAFNKERNIVFHVNDIYNYSTLKAYYKQPVNDGRLHDIRYYKTFEECYSKVCEFPIFTSTNFLCLYSGNEETDTDDILEISLSKMEQIPTLWDAIGEENRNLYNQIKDQKVKKL